MNSPLDTAWNITQELMFKKHRKLREQKRQQELQEIEQFLVQAHGVTPDDFAKWIHQNRQQFIDLLNKQVVSD